MYICHVIIDIIMLNNRDEIIRGIYQSLKKEAGFPSKQVRKAICTNFEISENTLKQILYKK